MSKKQDSFYFENFVACGEISEKAAQMLKEVLVHFEPESLPRRLEELHLLEHQGDEKKHELTDRVAKAFITPIEREDIAALAHAIDELTDKIEEVLMCIYMNNVQKIRPDAISLLDVVIQCCGEVCAMLREFPNFRHSKKLKEAVIRINSFEEEADRLYLSSMRSLHLEEDVRSIIAWREIYTYLEKCADACEHVADGVAQVVMKNS
ncbi:MAG: DUF47 family protein [Eubacteriales bacterium]|nr:DUF47 family protein [Eubacteriales bacterium]